MSCNKTKAGLNNMKKNALVLPSAILLSLSWVFLFVSCSRLPVFESYGTYDLIDTANNRIYLLSGSFRASQIYREPYARHGDRTLYAIPGVDPAEWLSENIWELGMPALFREASIEEPTLENFGTSIIRVKIMGDALDIEINRITDEQRIAQIIYDYTHGESVSPPLANERRLVRFESPQYPRIFYVLEYLVDIDGQRFLFNRWTGRCVVLTDQSLMIP